MRFLERLQRRWMDGNARLWGKECARVMLFAFLVKKNQYESTAPTYAWITRQTMLTRNHWAQVGEKTMLYDRSGQTVEVPDDDSSLRFAIHAVIEIEYGFELSKLTNSRERADMLREAHNAAERYLTEKSGH
jgi:hypothetical protein